MAPTRQEWLDLARQHETKSRELYEAGDLVLAEMYENKADAARECACYAREEEKLHS